ncbi:MAG TPA: YihY/virulence factor BrkB family protein [Gemmatimonadaceae bacterium]|nr:YihY/virulence factor BrkB family protein [Gemmatimonadaceae bacterium]
MVIKGFHVGHLLKAVGKAIWADNILTIAAAVAYNFFFSIFPLLLFAAPLLALVGNKQQLFNWILDQLAGSVPPAAYTLLAGVARDVVFAPNAPGLVSIGAVLTLYSASNIFGSLMGALNIAYHVKNDRRPWWKQRLIQLGMVVVAGGLMTLAAAVMIAGPNIVDTVARFTRLDSLTKWGWMILQYPLAFTFLVSAFWLMYYILPDFPQHKRQILVGAVIAAALWVLATTLFRLYVVNFTTFNKAYGTVGAVLLLLSWMYYSMVVVLAGGELNAELAKGTGEVAPEPKTEYDKKVAAAQTERAKEDRHEEKKKEQKEVRSNAKREQLAKS